jgi:hypothetical protein
VLTFNRLPGGVGFQTPVVSRCASARITRPIGLAVVSFIRRIQQRSMTGGLAAPLHRLFLSALHALEALEHSNFPS